MTGYYCCNYDDHLYLAAPLDNDRIYILNYGKDKKKAKVSLKNEKLTDFWHTNFLFVLKPEIQEKDMPAFWELLPNTLELEQGLLGMIYGTKDDGMKAIEVGYRLIDKTYQRVEYIKENGKLNMKDGAFSPEREDIRYEPYEWFQKYFELEYLKNPTDQNYLFSQTLKKQYADNPAFELDDLLTPASVMVNEMNTEFPNSDVPLNTKYLRDTFHRNWHTLNEFAYYAKHHEYVPDFYAFKFLGISAESIARKEKKKPLNAFISLDGLAWGDTLNRLHELIVDDEHDTLPKLRNFLSE